MRLEGLERLLGNISRNSEAMREGVTLAAQDIAHMLEAYAKTHTGKTPRPGRWISRPGLGYRKRARVRDATAPGGYRYPANSYKVWRPPGMGWGDVTGLLRKTIRARPGVRGDMVVVVLSANTPYAPNLELGRGGKWKWLGPAVLDNKQRIIRIINARLRR